MTTDLATTNLLLGIMAAVMVLEALVVLGFAIAGFVAYRRIMEVVRGLEVRQIDPLMTQMRAILMDVREVTSKVKDETERVDQAIRTTMDRVDNTADRVRATVRVKTSRLVGIMRGLRVAIESMLQAPEQPTQGEARY
jgi:hypothetical protein